MSLVSLLLPVAGVAAIVLVCWLAGGTGQAEIADAEAARAALREDEPDFAPARVLLARDRRAALLADASGADVGAVMAFGDKLVTRRLAPGAIRSAGVHERPGRGRVLTVLTYDPTCRRIDVALGQSPESPESPESIDLWLAALQRLVAPAARPSRAEEA